MIAAGYSAQGQFNRAAALVNAIRLRVCPETRAASGCKLARWPANTEDTRMSEISTPGTFAECADELNDFVASLERYPDTVLAFALAAHLGALLEALRIQGEWSAEEVAEFLRELASEAASPEPVGQAPGGLPHPR
jgi:hypothetical protein